MSLGCQHGGERTPSDGEESRLNWEIAFGYLQEWNGSAMEMKGTGGSGAEEFPALQRFK